MRNEIPHTVCPSFGTLYFREEVPYTRERLDSRDTSRFTIGQIDVIVDNPVYGYGTVYYLGELCLEWHNVFEFAMAISGKVWNLESVQPVYEIFLKYLEQNICETSEAKPIIGKSFFSRL